MMSQGAALEAGRCGRWNRRPVTGASAGFFRMHPRKFDGSHDQHSSLERDQQEQCHQPQASTHDLRPCNFDTKFFWQPLPDFFRQAVMHAAGALLGGVEHRDRGRRCDRHSKPNQSGKSESGQCGDFQPECVPRGKMPDHPKREQENPRRKGRHPDQPNVNNAVDLLPAATVLALRKVVFVVASHLCREAGDIVPPACEDLSNNRINALLTHEGVHRLITASPRYNRIGSSASVWVASSTRLQNSPPRVASAFSASLRAISG